VIKINCDLCGKVEESLARALIEGVELDVCRACSRFGKIVTPVRRPSPKEQHRQFQKREAPKEEKIELLVENYAEIIKKKRESLGMQQKDFAVKIGEKDSIVHKIETGSFVPQLSLARKIEKFLGVRIVEEHTETHEESRHKKEEGFTLGDFIKAGK